MEDKVCRYCDKHFTKRKGTGFDEWKKRIYCSRDCYFLHIGQRVHYSKCQVCGEQIQLVPSKTYRTKYCSLKCRDEDWKNNSPIGGKKHWNWNGGRKKLSDYIYIQCKRHPNAIAYGYMAEHRLVMEKKIGRYLTANEEVHHKNGIKTDNRIENLEIVVKEKHFGVVKCPHCLKEFKIK